MNATIIAIAALILGVINLAIGVILVVKVTSLADYEEIHVETNRKLLEIDSDLSKHMFEYSDKVDKENNEFRRMAIDLIEKDHSSTINFCDKLKEIVQTDHENWFKVMQNLRVSITDSNQTNDERWAMLCDHIRGEYVGFFNFKEEQQNDKANSEIPECRHCWRDEETGEIKCECEEL